LLFHSNTWCQGLLKERVSVYLQEVKLQLKEAVEIVCVFDGIEISPARSEEAAKSRVLRGFGLFIKQNWIRSPESKWTWGVLPRVRKGKGGSRNRREGTSVRLISENLSQGSSTHADGG
jgi:hypothetical protein